MKKLGGGYVRRARVFGLKPLAARLLATRPVNAVARQAIRAASPDTRVRLPLSLSAVEYRQGGGPVMLLDPSVDVVARDVYWGAGKPQAPADARTLRIAELLCAEPCTFFDIGSYDGIFALAAATINPDVRAVAFEIVPENFLLIWRNIIANDLGLRVEARLLGVGDRNGSMRIPARLGLASLASSISIGSQFEHGVEIPLDTLDAIAADVSGRVVMKIDVEGFEGAVFRGGAETVRRCRPDIICEFLRSATEIDAVEAMLKPLGYRFFQSLPEGFRENSSIVPRSDGWNWLLTCRPDADALVAKAAS